MYAASVVVILASLCPLVLLAEDGLTSRSDNLPAGDPGRCLTGRNRDMFRFEVLPGGGWDNLRNVHAGEVLGKNYSLCRTTEDGRFLLPDGIYTIPIKSSNVETFAELIEHWDNYTSTFSRSINIHAGLNLQHVSISGKFSYNYEHVKSSQYYQKSATVRTQGRYVRYRARANPDTALSDPIRARLRQIGAHLILNNTDIARYESQLLVRDFGTHVITSVDAGAALVQVMNDKLNYCTESLELFNNRLNDNRHVRLEWFIIALIIIEVMFEIVHFAERVFMDRYNTPPSQLPTDQSKSAMTIDQWKQLLNLTAMSCDDPARHMGHNLVKPLLNEKQPAAARIPVLGTQPGAAYVTSDSNK